MNRSYYVNDLHQPSQTPKLYKAMDEVQACEHYVNEHWNDGRLETYWLAVSVDKEHWRGFKVKVQVVTKYLIDPCELNPRGDHSC